MDRADGPIRILCLEDDPGDVELMQATLASSGVAFELTRVEAEPEFRRALEGGNFDVILADYALPAFDGLAALSIARAIEPEIPFILVSGRLGEEPAIEALTKGATDYVLKNKLSRLVPAVRRALAEAGERYERHRAEAAARELLEENRLLARRLLEVQEEERRHLARELHDEIGQCLTAIQAETELIRRRVGADDAEIATSTDAIQALSSNIYDTVHTMLQRMRPAALDNLGLVEALSDTIDAWQKREPDTRVDFQHCGQLTDLGEAVNITLFRAVQECLTNVASHAAASQVWIELIGPDAANDHRLPGHADQSVTLVVKDNGCAWSPGGQQAGFGLIGMRERVESLSGRFMLEADPGQGVTVTVVVPLGNAAQ